MPLNWEAAMRTAIEPWTDAMTEQGVLTAGGYRVMGRRIAVDLARDYQAGDVVLVRRIERTRKTGA